MPPNPVSTEKLRTAIYSSGKSQATIARATGISDASVTRYISGLRKPGPETLPRLAAVLGVRPDDLIGP